MRIIVFQQSMQSKFVIETSEAFGKEAFGKVASSELFFCRLFL